MGTAPIYQTKNHWIFNVFPVIRIIIGLWGFVLISGDTVNKVIGFIMLYYFLFQGLKDFLYNKVSVFSITPKYLKINTGIISKYSAEIEIDRIELVFVYQSWLGRLFNYGEIVIKTPNSSIPYTVENPNEFKKQINLIKEK